MKEKHREKMPVRKHSMKKISEWFSARKNAAEKTNKSTGSAERSDGAGKPRAKRGITRAWTAVIAASAAAALILGTVGYAIYAERISGWPQNVSIQSFSFMLNGNSSGKITSEELFLAKGEEAELELAVDIKGYANNRFEVPFEIQMSFDDTDATGNALARAIEVYSYTDGEYRFVSMLDSFLGAEGMMLSGTAGVDSATVFRYRLVYSPAAGDFYEGKTFTLTAEADHGEPSYTNDKYYIYSAKDFANAAADAELRADAADTGITFVLLNDITLTGNVAINFKAGIDLNGFTLNTGTNSLSVNYSDAYSDADARNTLTIGDSVGGGSVTGTGISISCANDCLPVADSLLSSNINVTAFSDAALAGYIQKNLKALEREPVSSDATGVDVTKGLKKYIGGTSISPLDTDVFLSVSSGVAAINADFDRQVKSLKYVQFSIDSAYTVSASLTFSGSSAYSIAEELVAKIPETIHSSLFFPRYDETSGARITWISSRSELLNSDGVFLENGYESFDDWTNQFTDIGIIVEKDGERYTAIVTREVCILTPEERTRIIYDYASIYIPAVGNTYALGEHIDDISVEGVSKLGFIGAGISIDTVNENQVTNKNFTGDSSAKWYIDYSGDGASYTVKTLVEGTVTPVTITAEDTLETKIQPQSIGALILDAELTFYYSDTSREEDSAYTMYRSVAAAGTTAQSTLDDPTISLQPSFTSNGYTDGDGVFSFLADGSYTGTGSITKVDYGFPANSEWDANDIIDIVNGIYVPSPDGAFYNDGGVFRVYTESAGDVTRYDRQSLIIIKSENVSTETKIAELTAKLVTNDAPAYQTYSNAGYLGETGCYIENWGNTAKTYEQEDGADVTLGMTLEVEGLYHNRATEVADTNLWIKLLTYYDRNGDGYISVKESLRDPISYSESASAENTAAGLASGSYSYLDFSGLGISSLKGIEYFRNVEGLDFSSVSAQRYNSVIDISNLSELYNLRYLKLSDNQVADISALRYLDALEFLDLGNGLDDTNNNNITDVTPLRYLPSVRYLDLSMNTRLADIEMLQDYSELRYLNINGTSLGSEDNQYYITLIYNNCSANFDNQNKGILYSGIFYAPGSEIQNAAAALKNLDIIDETFNTLRLLTAEKWNGVTYYFCYGSGNTGSLRFRDAGNLLTGGDGASWRATTGWEITSPIVDMPVDIWVYTSSDATVEGSTANKEMYVYTLRRKFTVNILQLAGHDNMVYIENSDGEVRVAGELVQDKTLCGLLFNNFNVDTSATDVYVDIVNGVYEIVAQSQTAIAIPQSRIVTQAEIAQAYANDASRGTLTYSGRGITSLAGIEAFSDGIYKLNLTNNTINEADISPLASLENLTELVLAGQEYDFSQLSRFSDSEFTGYEYNDATKGTYGAGLTSLEVLSVYGCYNLDNEDVLASLYQVYLMNKDVKIYMTSEFTGTVSADDDIWKPYELPLAKYLGSLPSVFTYVTITEGVNDWHTTCLYKDENGALRIYAELDGDGYYVYKFRFYDVWNIKFVAVSTGGILDAGSSPLSEYLSAVRKDATTTTNAVADHNGLTGFRYTTLVGYTDTAYSKVNFAGNEDADFASLGIGRDERVDGEHYVEHKVEFNHNIKIRVDGHDYTVNELFPGRSLITSVMASYDNTNGFMIGTATGAPYLAKDAQLSSGQDEIFVLGNNRIFVRSSDAGKSARDNYLFTTGMFLPGGSSSIQGLQYTSVTTLDIGRETILGDGSWLMNIQSLYIGYSAVDLSTLRYELPNLTSFNVGLYSNNINTARHCWDVNMYDASEYNIDDPESDIYKLIVGLKSGGNYADITAGNTLPGVSDYYSGGSLQKEAFFNTDTSGTDAEALYSGLREIARSRDADGNYYFYLNYMPNVANFRITCTDVYDWTGLLAYMFREDTAPSSADGNYYNDYYDRNDLSSLMIYGITGNSFATKNSNGGVAEPIIRKLYQSYFGEHGERPSYRIGELGNNASTALYHPESYVDGGGNTVQGWHDQQYTHIEDLDGIIEDFSDRYANYFNTASSPYVRKERVKNAEAVDFLTKMNDFGVKITDASGVVYHYASETQTVAGGAKIYLPATTGAYMFGSATDAVFQRDFTISWTKLSTTDGSAAIPATAVSGYYEYSYTPTYDTYVVFIGTVTAGSTVKTIYYPVLILGSAPYVPTAFGTYTATYSYSASSVSLREIADLQLRFWLYAHNSNSPRLNPATLGGESSAVLTVHGSAAYNSYKDYIDGIATLDGIGIYSGVITGIDSGPNDSAVVFRYLSDASDLAYLTGMTSVTLNNTLVSDVSWASSLTSLTSLVMKNGVVQDTYDTSGITYLPVSLQTLDLRRNVSVRAADIEAMVTGTKKLTNLTSLNVYTTAASNDEASIQAIIDILQAKGTGSTLSISLAADGAITVNEEKLTAARDYIAGNAYGTTAGKAQVGAVTGNPFPNYVNLIRAARTTAFYQVDTSTSWNAGAFGGGVTVTILNQNIYASGFLTLKSATEKVVNYMNGFAVSVKLGSYTYTDAGGTDVTFNFAGQVDIIKTAYVEDSGGATRKNYKLVFATSPETVIAYENIDPEIYAYILRTYGCTQNVAGGQLEFTSSAVSSIQIGGNAGAGVTSLRGTEKIPGLITLSLTGSLTYIASLRDLGFDSVNTSVTSFTLGDYTDSRADELRALSYLTGLKTLDLLYVSGVDYDKTITSVNKTLAEITATLNPATLVTVNNQLNFYRNGTGIASDMYMFNSTGGGSFGGKSIPEYNQIDLYTVRRLTNLEGSNDTSLQTYDYSARSRLTKVYTDALWWSGDTLANKTPSLRKLGFTDLSAVMGYVSDKTASAGALTAGRLRLPLYVCEADLNGGDPNEPGRNVPLVITLPKSFTFIGETYNITWTAATDSANTIDWTGMFSNTGTYAVLTLNGTNIAQFEDDDKITLTGTRGSDTVTHEITVVKDLPPVYYSASTQNNSRTDFYIELENGEIVQANQFFDSYRLLYWLYNNDKYKYVSSGTAVKDSNGNRVAPQTLAAGGKVASENSVYTGKYLTLTGKDYYFSYEQIMSIATLELRMAGSNTPSSGIGSASLKGLELFKNLKALVIYQGYVTSLEPLRNLRLSYFEYLNSDTGSTNIIIQDWTPLYNSRDTLQVFKYAHRSFGDDMQIYHDELSFLMGFTNLKSVTIGYSGVPDSINKLPSFKYMLAWDSIEGNDVKIIYNGVELISGGNINADGGVSTDTLNAAQILRAFSGLESDFEYKYNHELLFKTPVSGDSITGELPGYINRGGIIYPIEWVSMSTFVNIAYTDAGGTPVAVTNESEYFSPASGNKWVLTLTEKDQNYLSHAYVIARINTGGAVYERVFSINCADESARPSLFFEEGFASFTLPGYSYSSVYANDAVTIGVGADRTFTYYNASGYNGSAYYTISADARTVWLKAAAYTADEVIINVSGVPTRLYFDADPTIVSTGDTLHASLVSDGASLGQLATLYPDTAQGRAALAAKVQQYEEIPAGKWVYMCMAYPNDAAGMLTTINTLRTRLSDMSSPTVNIVYSGLDGFDNKNDFVTTQWKKTDGTVQILAPSITGRFFIGWYTDQAYTNAITSFSTGTMADYLSAGTITVYPRFFESGSIVYSNPASIGFTHTNAGTLSSANSFAITLTDAVPTPLGYIFGGWYLDSAFTRSIETITPSAFIDGSQTNASIQVFAKLTLQPMNVVFNLNLADTTGLTNPNSVSEYNPGLGDISLEDVVIGSTADIYGTKIFDGWYTQAVGGVKKTHITTSDYTANSTYTLYAHYTDLATHRWLVLRTYSGVSSYSNMANWEKSDIYYRLDGNGSQDKIQINGVSGAQEISVRELTDMQACIASKQLSYGIPALSEQASIADDQAFFILSSGASPVGSLVDTTLKWNGASVLGYTQNGTIASVGSMNPGSYTFTINGSDLLCDFSYNGKSYEGRAGTSDDVSYVYTATGPHNSGTTFGTNADIGMTATRKSTTDGAVTSNAVNWVNPNKYYTLIYLMTETDSEGRERDLYTIKTNNNALFKISQSFSDVNYYSTSVNKYLDLQASADKKVAGEAPFRKKTPLTVSGATYNNVGWYSYYSNAEVCNGEGDCSQGNYTSSGYVFFCPQGYEASTGGTYGKYIITGNAVNLFVTASANLCN